MAGMHVIGALGELIHLEYLITWDKKKGLRYREYKPIGFC
jgi:hypothetical protein